MIRHCQISKSICGLLLYVILLIIRPAESYKQVIFMHGILAGPNEFDYFSDLVQKYHPGTPSIQVNLYNFAASVTNMWTQVANISHLLTPTLTNRTSEGSVLVCFSQGGLICRALLATVEHNVETFISLSCPLAGQYGDTDYLKKLFPHYLKQNIYKVFYSKTGQKFSVANYWNDPHQQELFLNFSSFLAVLNNQSVNVNPKSQEYKSNFLRLKNLVLIGGPDDGVITPWQSSQFGMFNSSENVLPMEEQQWYLNDAFGLKTMKARGSIHVHTIPGIRHTHWHSNDTVFEKYVKPWLT